MNAESAASAPARPATTALSPDGRQLASAATDKGVRLWDALSGKLAKQLEVGKQPVTFLAFDPSGRYLLARAHNALRLFELPSGVARYRLDAVCAATGFAAGGTELLFGMAKENPFQIDTLKRIDVATGKEKQADSLSSGRYPYVFSPSGKYLLRSDYRAAEIVELASARDKWSLKPIQPFSIAAFAIDERSLIVARDKKKLTLLELSGGAIRCEFDSPDDDEICLALAPDGRWLASGSLDRTVLLWDLTGRMKDGKFAAERLDAAALKQLWHDLDSADGRKAYAALWRLAAGAEDSIPFLAQHVQPARAADPARTAALLRDLDSGGFAARQRAADELEKLGPAAESALKKSLAGTGSLEFRRRAERLLARLDSAWTTQRQVPRALEALERMATPDAEHVLQRLAEGDPGARLTEETRTILRRRFSGGM